MRGLDVLNVRMQSVGPAVEGVARLWVVNLLAGCLLVEIWV